MPILIDANDRIIAGEKLVEAAKSLGMTEVPVLCIEHLDEGEARALRIAMNKLSEGSEWDRQALGFEFRDLLELELDWSLDVTGFHSVEIDNMVCEITTVAEEEEDAEAAAAAAMIADGPAISQIGDIWELGDHRLLCGSSLEPASLARLMEGERAAMVLTDQPYNVRVQGHVSGLGKHRHREFVQASGEMSEEEFTTFLTGSIITMRDACEDGAYLYLYMDWRHIGEMNAAIRAAGLKLINVAVWVKNQGGMGSLYRSQHELVFIAKHGHGPARNNVQLGRFGRSRKNCWFYPGVNTFGKGRDELLALHPTPKNVSMLADAIRDVTGRGEIVLDGFLGSGSTLIACERTGRICRGVELDPLYVDLIVRRFEKETGLPATLQATGQTFAQVAERRLAEPEPTRPNVVARQRFRAAA